jgi:hypothetical protein
LTRWGGVITDPDGNNLEFAFGQKVGLADG